MARADIGFSQSVSRQADGSRPRLARQAAHGSSKLSTLLCVGSTIEKVDSSGLLAGDSITNERTTNERKIVGKICALMYGVVTLQLAGRGKKILTQPLESKIKIK